MEGQAAEDCASDPLSPSSSIKTEDLNDDGLCRAYETLRLEEACLARRCCATSASHSRKRGSPGVLRSAKKHSTKAAKGPEIFACPYYKHDPTENGACAGYSKELYRVKEHVLRKHLQPVQCRRCGRRYGDEGQIRTHQKAGKCAGGDLEAIQSFQEVDSKTKEKANLIKRGSRGTPTWERLYRILFDHENELEIPTPYNDESSVMNLSPLVSVEAPPSPIDFTRFVDYYQSQQNRLLTDYLCDKPQSLPNERKDVKAFSRYYAAKIPRIMQEFLVFGTEENVDPDGFVDYFQLQQGRLLAEYMLDTDPLEPDHDPKRDDVACFSKYYSERIPRIMEEFLVLRNSDTAFHSATVVTGIGEPEVVIEPEYALDTTFASLGGEQIDCSVSPDLANFDLLEDFIYDERVIHQDTSN